MTQVRPNVVDSSAWLAYFADEPTTGESAAAIEDVERLVVPAVCLLVAAGLSTNRTPSRSAHS